YGPGHSKRPASNGSVSAASLFPFLIRTFLHLPFSSPPFFAPFITTLGTVGGVIRAHQVLDLSNACSCFLAGFSLVSSGLYFTLPFSMIPLMEVVFFLTLGRVGCKDCEFPSFVWLWYPRICVDLDGIVALDERRPIAMSRRPVNNARRFPDSSSVPFVGSLHPKARTSPVLSVGLLLLGGFLLVLYSYGGSVFHYLREGLLCFQCYNFQVVLSVTEELSVMKATFIDMAGASCTAEVQQAIPFLKKAYGDSMLKVLHVGPETCSVVFKLLKEEDTEAWGVEPYDMEDADSSCKILVRKGIVREADIKFPLPYRQKSFSLVIVSDALDYLSPKYLNKTLPELARVSTDGVVIFSGYPGQQRIKVQDQSKFGKPAKLRSSSWWIRFFVQIGLEENETAAKKFEQATIKRSYTPGCQVFHLNPSHRY
ncbi:hypothetical protein Taro_052111, partial [Colocasia esculenta]|nr:hypothetical protein [Colocasia esculenta]